MGFRIFMLIVVLLIPLTMLLFGWLFFRRTPKEINYIFGYRTKRSMRNEETWKFANQYFGKVWYLCGLLSAPLSVIAMVIVFEKGTETMSTVGFIITMIQTIPFVGAMISTEIALKKNFDENGRRK
nr:SdpI family protein [uncultured Streptococcus sp.]